MPGIQQHQVQYGENVLYGTIAAAMGDQTLMVHQGRFQHQVFRHFTGVLDKTGANEGDQL